MPYGYSDQGDGHLVFCASEQRAIQIIVERRKHGDVYRKIAEYLESEGFRPRSGRKWPASTLKAIYERVACQDAADGSEADRYW